MSVAGKWHISMKTPIGTQKFTCDFEHDGGAWRGTIDGQGNSAAVEDLKVEGESVGFSARVKGPVGMIDLNFSGAVAADELNGTCKTQFGNFTFTGARG